jgi:hypothetical protein
MSDVKAFGRAGLAAGERRVIRVTAAQVMSDSLISGRRSWSRQWRRALMIHDQERSTTHLRGRTTKPLASGGRFTVLMVMSRYFFAQVTSFPP